MKPRLRLQLGLALPLFLSAVYLGSGGLDERTGWSTNAQPAIKSERTQGNRSETNNRSGIGPSFKGPLGLQLYSLRAEFAKDVPGTLAKVRAMGFREVEMGGTYGLTPEQFRAEMNKAGLRAVSMGASFDSLRDNIETV